MEADLKSLNKFLAGFELEGGSFSGYRRLFSNGDITASTSSGVVVFTVRQRQLPE